MATVYFVWVLCALVLEAVNADFKVNDHEMWLHLGNKSAFNLSLTRPLPINVNVTFDIQHKDLVRTNPTTLNVMANQDVLLWEVEVYALNPGHSVIGVNVTPANVTNFVDAFVRVTIRRSDILYHISSVVGWIYFLAWSVSFYPQIYSNYRRKSVVGLNFDFLSLNLLGFVMYSLFNCGLFWIPEIWLEYLQRYPRGVIPVQINDVFFSLHAVLATVITISQCFMYEIGGQRISTTARIIHSISAGLLLVSIILSFVNVIAWLDFLYICGYIKLAITLIKYVPQAYFNYQRKSTVGWSIGNIFLDFTGGILSMLQMILNAYNYDDWHSIFGDPTKFGLGFFSVAFDIFFIVQHYVLYSDSNLCDWPKSWTHVMMSTSAMRRRRRIRVPRRMIAKIAQRIFFQNEHLHSKIVKIHSGNPYH
ncbi:cystinosin homolog isoform X2 [Diachasmimorpha longicaudata]|uniref:cystinosin homolog isoform X2 n=1 Tax=Diachasmimorpha longicaudata TaxID=58733 RepID=UPI0030B8D1ED